MKLKRNVLWRKHVF